MRGDKTARQILIHFRELEPPVCHEFSSSRTPNLWKATEPQLGMSTMSSSRAISLLRAATEPAACHQKQHRHQLVMSSSRDPNLSWAATEPQLVMCIMSSIRATSSSWAAAGSQACMSSSRDPYLSCAATEPELLMSSRRAPSMSWAAKKPPACHEQQKGPQLFMSSGTAPSLSWAAARPQVCHEHLSASDERFERETLNFDAQLMYVSCTERNDCAALDIGGVIGSWVAGVW